MKDNKISSTLDILKRCLQELEGMSSEEVQRISKKKHIIIPHELIELESRIDHSVRLCVCSEENYIGFTSINCCNTCGHPQEEFWINKQESNTDSHIKISKSKGDFRDMDNFESQSEYFGKSNTDSHLVKDLKGNHDLKKVGFDKEPCKDELNNTNKPTI